MLRGVLRNKTFLIVLEPDMMHGRVTLTEAVQALHKLEADDQYQHWGLDKEIEGWGGVIPGAEELAHILFKHEPISW